MTEVFCGIDWAEGHHDIALVDQQGRLVASQRIEDTAAGLTELLDLLSTHGDLAGDRVPVASKPHAASSLRLSFACALVAVVFTWFTAFAAPVAAQHAAARGDYGNLFTFRNIAWGIVLVLDLLALVLGTRGARQPTGKVLSGAAIGIGATGVLGVLVYNLVPFQVMRFIS